MTNNIIYLYPIIACLFLAIPLLPKVLSIAIEIIDPYFSKQGLGILLVFSAFLFVLSRCLQP